MATQRTVYRHLTASATLVGQNHTMSRSTAKVAISLERSLFLRAERLRASTGESRSALLGRALRQVLHSEAHDRDVERYVEAYKRSPETAGDQSRARRIARRSMASLPWDDE